MADKLISQLDAAGALADADKLELEQGADPSNTSGYATLAQLRTFFARDPVTALSIVSGEVTIDCSLGKSFTLALTANVTTVTLTNLAGAGRATEIEIQITQDGTGGRTFAMPAAFKALGGSDTAIASAANAVTVISAKTFDNGTTWRYAMQESA